MNVLSLTDFISTKILARDSIVYFASVTGMSYSSLYTTALSSVYTYFTAMLVFNLSYTRSHSLLGTTLTLYVSFAAFTSIAHVLSYRPTSIGASIAVCLHLILKFHWTLTYPHSFAMYRLLD